MQIGAQAVSIWQSIDKLNSGLQYTLAYPVALEQVVQRAGGVIIHRGVKK